MADRDDIAARKSDHLAIIGAGGGRQDRRSTGFEAVHFAHVALPELDFAAIDTGCTLFGRPLSAPLLVSAMTGGPAEAGAINAAIAEACQALRLPLAVGSQRIALEGRGDAGLRGLRQRAPDVPMLANLGAVQLNCGMGPADCLRAVEMLQADALILHLNPLQEAIQPHGDRNFAGLLDRIATVCAALPVPVGVKEVGAGLSAAVGRRLIDAGVTLIDVAGLGGTSWAQVEGERGGDSLRALAAPFADWGIPTAQAVADMAPVMRPGCVLIASGGVRDGLDVARAIRLGADLAGQAAGALPAARDGAEALATHLHQVVTQLRIAMFCTGSADLAALRDAALLAPLETSPREG